MGTSKSSFENAILIIKGHEGGYSDRSTDPGNFFKGNLVGTNHGISAIAYYDYFKIEPTVEAMKSLTWEWAIEIYKDKYWDKNKLDKIEFQDLANLMFNLVVNCGCGGRLIQEGINCVLPNPIKEDGVIGSKTISAINKIDNYALFYAIKGVAYKFYLQHKNLKNNRGWISRILSFYFEH